MTKKLIKFGRPSCVPCGMVSDHFTANGVVYTEYDVEVDLLETTKFGVMGVPTVLLVDGDDILGRVVGYNPPALDELIEQL